MGRAEATAARAMRDFRETKWTLHGRCLIGYLVIWTEDGGKETHLDVILSSANRLVKSLQNLLNESHEPKDTQSSEEEIQTILDKESNVPGICSIGFGFGKCSVMGAARVAGRENDKEVPQERAFGSRYFNIL